MKKVIEVKYVISTRLPELESIVSIMLKSGWEPIDAIVVNAAGNYIQTMWLYG